MNANANLLQPLTIANAPAASKPIMEGIQKGFGFVPNLMATMAAPIDAEFASEK